MTKTDGPKRSLLLSPQVTRLAALAVIIVGVYLVARTFFVPASFGDYGWYRSDALAERASLPRAYAGTETCGPCHEKAKAEMDSSPHKAISCESCHGASGDHVAKSEDKALFPQKISDGRFCIRCHLKNPARPAGFPQIKEPSHSDGDACVDCHAPHNPEE